MTSSTKDPAGSRTPAEAVLLIAAAARRATVGAVPVDVAGDRDRRVPEQ